MKHNNFIRQSHQRETPKSSERSPLDPGGLRQEKIAKTKASPTKSEASTMEAL